MKLIDETGNRYAHLLVLGRAETVQYPSGQKKVLWNCLCDCGKETKAFGQTMRAGTVKSCGCLKTTYEIDLVGKKFSFVEVKSYEGFKTRQVKSGNLNTHYWNCLCDCGNEVIKNTSQLTKGSSFITCGCQKAPAHRKHGHTAEGKHSPTFTSWHAMVQRCTMPNNSAYHLYGALGVKCCDRWNPKVGGSFENFLEDMGERPKGMSLNRINSCDLYSKDTSEWATLSMQAFDQKIRNTNTSGRTGISWNKVQQSWEVYIDKNYKRIRLGFHSDFDHAVKVREEAELKYFGFIKQKKVLSG